MQVRRICILAAATSVALSAMQAVAVPAKTVAPVKAKSTLPAGVAATVNGQKITQEQLMKTLKDWQSPMVLDEIIRFTVVAQEAKKNGVIVTDAQVKAKMDELKKRIPAGEDFNDTLLRMYGLTPQHATAFIKMQLQAEGVVRKSIKLTPEDFADYRKAEHILIMTRVTDPKDKEKKEAESKQKIEDIAKEIQGGLSFEEAAKKYSEDPGSKDAGGDLNWFTKGTMVPEFQNAAFSMKVGQISEPIKTGYGYHLIKLTGIGNEATGADKKALEDKILQKKMGNMQQWVKDQFDKAKINNPLAPKKIAPKPAPVTKVSAPKVSTSKTATPAVEAPKTETPASSAKSEVKPAPASNETAAPSTQPAGSDSVPPPPPPPGDSATGTK